MATNWDKDKPAGSQKIRLSDEEIRANNTALEDAIGRNHLFPGAENTTAGEHTVVELQDQAGDPVTPASIVALYNNAGVLYTRKASSGTISTIGIPSGTKMLFIQNSAPTGWTFSATNNDKVLINQSTEANGGTTGGSWTLSGITAVAAALSIAQMPAHTHGVSFASSTQGGGSSPAAGAGSVTLSTSTGSGTTHTHGMTLGSSWRPAWVGVITCTKD